MSTPHYNLTTDPKRLSKSLLTQIISNRTEIISLLIMLNEHTTDGENIARNAHLLETERMAIENEISILELLER